MSKGIRTKFYVDLMAAHTEVTGSSILGIIKFPDGSTERFVVDCGLFQEKEYGEYNKDFPWKAENLNAAFLTHVHIDHAGRFPLLTKKGYNGYIYMTNDSKTLLHDALTDSAKVLADLAKITHEPLLYSQNNVDQTIQKTIGVNFEEKIRVTDHIDAYFFKNGHLPGAAIILIQIHFQYEDENERKFENINLLFTGDYNNKNMFFDVEDLPEWVKNLPVTIVCESTYGDKETTDIVKCFEANLVSEEFTTTIIPVFSLGRSQEVLYILKCMQNEGKLSTEIPIYFDGKLAFKYTSKYLKRKITIKDEMDNFLPENIIFVSRETRSSINVDVGRKIIVTTSGMGTYGPAQFWIPEYLKKEDALIHFTGYVAEGTLGRRMKEAEKGEIVKVGGLMIPKNARVEYTSEISAHAKANELIMLLQKFSNIRFILINHGQKESKRKFAERCIREVNTSSVGILDREYLFRIDAFGYVKDMPTKF